MAGTCPYGGLWFECLMTNPTFQGCCTSNPCSDGCPPDNLFAAGLPAGGVAATNELNAKCPSGSNWFTCVDQTPAGSFQGCCKSNPCNALGCPRADLVAAQFNSTSTATATSASTSKSSTSAPTATPTTSSTSTTNPISSNVTSSHPNNTPIIAGVVVGGVVLIALIGFLFWYLRDRRRKANSPDPSSMAMMKVPDNAVNADNEGFYAVGGISNGIRPDHDTSKNGGYTKAATQSPGPPPYLSPRHLSPHPSPTTAGFHDNRVSALSRLSTSTNGQPEDALIAPQQLDSTEIGMRDHSREFAVELPTTENQGKLRSPP